jgi:hypothetical protein
MVMMFIDVRVTGKIVQVEWHTGQAIPLSSDDITYITQIQADGNELQVIRRLFNDTIPFSQRLQVQAWYGDMAQYIVGNLRLAMFNETR